MKIEIDDFNIVGVKEMFYGVVNTDSTEGRGSDYGIVRSQNPITVERLVKGKGVQGCDGDVIGGFAVEIQTPIGRTTFYSHLLETYPINEDDKAFARRKEKLKIIEKAKTLGLTDEEMELLRT